MLISVFKFIRKSQVGEFDQGWSQTLQQIEPGKDRRSPALHSLFVKSNHKKNLNLAVQSKLSCSLESNSLSQAELNIKL